MKLPINDTSVAKEIYMNKNKIIVIVTCVLVAVILGYVGITMFSPKTNQPTNKMTQKYNNTKKVMDIEQVKLGTIEKGISAKGSVASKEIVDFNLPVTAKLDTIYVKNGSLIKEGDVLATYNMESLNQALKRTQEELIKAKKILGTSKPKYDYINIIASESGKIFDSYAVKKKSVESILKKREYVLSLKTASGEMKYGKSLPKGIITNVSSRVKIGKKVKPGDRLFTIKVPNTKFDDIKDNVVRIEKQIEIIKGLIEAPDVKSNCNGIVSEVKLKPGIEVKKEAEFIKIKPNNGFIITVEALLTDLDTIKIGQSAKVTFDSGEVVEATISHINYNGNQDGKFPVELTIIPTDNSRILPGMTGKVDIVLVKKEEIIIVPIDAIKTDSTGEYVMVFKGDESKINEYTPENVPKEKKYIERGIVDSMNAEIISGVSPSEKVIVIRTSNNEMDDYGEYGSMDMTPMFG